MTALEEEITAVDGVLAARVETIDGSPVSVRLDLDEGSDSAAVAGAVQSILRRHGLRSRMPEAPPDQAAADDDVAASSQQEPAAPTPMGDAEVADEVAGEPPAAGGTPAPVAAVTVRQTRSGVDVVVESAAGARAEAAATAHPDEVRRAIVGAVAELAGRRPPRLVDVSVQDVGGRRAVTVVVDLGVEDLAVGTVFETGTTELAVARAVWSALEG